MRDCRDASRHYTETASQFENAGASSTMQRVGLPIHGTATGRRFSGICAGTPLAVPGSMETSKIAALVAMAGLATGCAAASVASPAACAEDPCTPEDAGAPTVASDAAADAAPDPDAQSAPGLWPHATVPYEISSDAAPYSFLIDLAATTLTYRTHFKFVTHTSEPDYVIVTMTADASHSAVGRKGGAQFVWLNPASVKGISPNVVMHELGHAIGRRHEHQRPDRDMFITVNYGNVEQDDVDQFVLDQWDPGFPRYPYDVDFIMHYDSLEFSKNGLPTMVKASDGSLIVGFQGPGLSPTDITVFNDIAALSGM